MQAVAARIDPRLVRASLAVAAVLMVVVGLRVGSLAVFSDTATVDNNLFTVGTLDIATDVTTQLVTDPTMAPGDQVTAPLVVSNSGDMDLRYAITSTLAAGDDETLAQQLQLTIKTNVATCTDAGFGASGTQLYTGDLGLLAGTTLVGNTAQGQQAGDRVLTVGNNETLCFNVILPISTDGTFASQSANATFEFVAEQTINNP